MNCCGQTFKTQAEFERHQQSMHGAKAAGQQPHAHEHFNCCGQTFHGREPFEVHKRAAHGAR